MHKQINESNHEMEKTAIKVYILENHFALNPKVGRFLL